MIEPKDLETITRQVQAWAERDLSKRAYVSTHLHLFNRARTGYESTRKALTDALQFHPIDFRNVGYRAKLLAEAAEELDDQAAILEAVYQGMRAQQQAEAAS